MFTYPKVNFKIMTFAYQVTQFNGIDYSNKSPKWNLVSERRTQEQALKVCQVLNKRLPYFHRVEVVKSVELPKFTVLKPARNENQTLVIPASFRVIKKRNWFQSFIRRFF